MATSATSRFESMGQSVRAHEFEDRLAHARPPQLNNSLDFLLEHPIRSLLVGLGLGLLVSAVLMRR